MTAREAQCIISVAKYKSISRAAKEVFVTQQALSKIVDRVEKEIGVRLFNRLTSGIEITALGSQILPVIVSFYSSYGKHIKIINDIINKDKGCITISMEHQYLYTLIPEDLLTSFNVLGIKTVVADTIKKCIDDVRRKKYSMGICHKQKNFSGLEYIPIIDEAAHVLMRNDHPLASRKELALSDLKGVPLFEILSGSTPNEILISAFAQEGFYPNFVSRIDNLDMTLRNIRSGAGVAIGSRFFVPESYDDIICVPLKHETVTMEIGFILPAAPSPDVLSFIRMVTAYHSS